MRNSRWCGAAQAIVLTLVSAACSQYSGFTLPSPPAGPEIRFEWELHPDPVLGRGPEAWDAGDVLNPTIVRFGGVFWNLYSGFDGHAWHTGIATSADPFGWVKRGLVLSPAAATWEGGAIAANGSALVRDGRLWYWYQAGDPPRIALATSLDGRAWTKHASPVLPTGPLHSWDERGIGDPDVIETGGRLYLFYTGIDRARRQRLGIAQSADGVRWTKLRSGPILDIGPDGAFDENGLGEPAVWASNGHYWMLYTGRDRNENRRTGLAESEDGIAWRRSSRAKVLSGDRDWDGKVVCDPSVLAARGGVHVWFGGGDVARPDQGLHGQIGYAFLRAVPR